MNISRKIVLTGVVTLGVFALGSAGAAVAHTLTIEDHTGAVQNIAPVTTGTTSPAPSASPFDDKSDDPTGTTTVAPAPPINVDDDEDDSDEPQSGVDDEATHDLVDDNESDGSVDNTGESGLSGSGSVGSGSTSDSGGSDDSGSSSGSGHDDGSGDTGGQD